MEEHVCDYCGKIFLAYKSNRRKYCSKECAINKSWQNRERAKKAILICLNCHKAFELKACETRVKENRVHYCSAKCRDEAKKTGKIIKCKQCGISFYSTRNQFCSHKCACQYKKQHYNHKKYKENGYEIRYIQGYNKKGNVKEHRYIMEQYLGRRLNTDEVVHHKDGNKLNNNINNLEVMKRGEHSRLHRRKELEDGKQLFKQKNI